MHVLCLAWAFHGSLLLGKADSLQQNPAGPPSALSSMSEMVYEVESNVLTQARLIRNGIFPSWSPYSQAGTPLIGKMQNGVFAACHWPIYAAPDGARPYVLTLVLLLKCLLGFSFAYLYSRSVGLRWAAATAAGTLFAFPWIAVGQLFAWSGAGLFMPLALLLVEAYLGSRRRLASFLIPWAAALPFFSGHFESAFMVHAAAGAYFLLRLRGLPLKAGEKVALTAKYLGLLALGVGLAAIQIAPALEYVDWSYNKIWHNAKWFAFWEFEVINKHLSADDAPVLIAGWAAVIAAFWLARRSAAGAALEAKSLSRKLAAAGCLAAGLAFLANAGWDDSLHLLAVYNEDPGHWLLGLSLLFLAAWHWRREENPSLRALGWLMIGGLLLLTKTPPLSNILLHAPLVSNFHMTSHRWEYHLALAVLAPAALQRLWDRSGLPFSERKEEVLTACLWAAAFAAGYAGSLFLKGPLLRAIPTSPAAGSSREAAGGGFLGPERGLTFSRELAVAGYVPSFPPPTRIQVVLLEGNQPAASADATASLSSSGDRAYFSARLPLAKAALFQVAAKVEQGGQTRYLRGALFESRPLVRPAVPPWAVVLVVALVPLLFLLPAAPLLVVGSAAATFALQFQSQGVPAGDLPWRLPGIEKLRADGDLYRTYSLNPTFLQPDFTGVYGLYDLRTGGDNLDVLTMIYFSQVLRQALGDRNNKAMFEVGLKLLDLANVKYLLEAPGTPPPFPGFEAYYSGADMAVSRNPRVRPRALFFDRYAYAPLDRWRDWGSIGNALGPIVGQLGAGNLDPASTVLLHDMPQGAVGGGKGPAKAEARVVEYAADHAFVSVDADRPGVLFLSDNYFPGWRATVNGQSARILRSWITFRAVEVPAGHSDVVFDYRPGPLRLGVVVSLLLALGWGVWWGLGRWKPMPPPPVEVTPVKNAGKSKKALPAKAPLAPEPAELAPAFAWSERIFLAVLLPWLAFWLVWAVFLYNGGATRRWSRPQPLFRQP